MTTTNVYTREPTKLDYASPVQFRFKCSKLPTVEFFCQTANIPGISIGSASILWLDRFSLHAGRCSLPARPSPLLPRSGVVGFSGTEHL